MGDADAWEVEYQKGQNTLKVSDDETMLKTSDNEMGWEDDPISLNGRDPAGYPRFHWGTALTERDEGSTTIKPRRIGRSPRKHSPPTDQVGATNYKHLQQMRFDARSCPTINESGRIFANPLMPNGQLPETDPLWMRTRHARVKTVNPVHLARQRIVALKQAAIQRWTFIPRDRRAVKCASTLKHSNIPEELDEDDAFADVPPVEDPEPPQNFQERIGKKRLEKSKAPVDVAPIGDRAYVPPPPAKRFEKPVEIRADSVATEASDVIGSDPILPSQPSSNEAEESAEEQESLIPEPKLKNSNTDTDELVGQFESLEIGRKCAFPDRDGGNPFAQNFYEPTIKKTKNIRIETSCFCSIGSESPAGTELCRTNFKDLAAPKITFHSCNAIYRSEKGKAPRRCANEKELAPHWLPQLGKLEFFCTRHGALLKEHKICPLCNEFYEEGDEMFVVCHGVDQSESHLYHLSCRKAMKLQRQCPHCLQDRSLCIEEWYIGENDEPSRNSGNNYYIDFNKVFEGLGFVSIIVPVKDRGNVHVGGYFTSKEQKDFASEPSNSDNDRVSDDEFARGIHMLDLWALVRACRQESPGRYDRDADGNSLLHLAAREGKAIAVVLLHNCGLNINDRNAARETPLIVAVKSGSLAVIFALEKSGADMHARDKLGRTCLHWAAFYRNFRLMMHLMEMGASSEIKDNNGHHPVSLTLLWIQEMDFYELVGAGICLTGTDRDGWSLLHWIACLQRNDLVKYFLDSPLPYMRDRWGDTPVHVAVRVGNHKFVELLLTIKAPLEVLRFNNENKTPYHLTPPTLPRLPEELKEVENYMATIKSLMQRHLCMQQTELAKDDGRNPPPLVPIGEIWGDLSRGKNIVPIPVYNFKTAGLNNCIGLQQLLFTDVVLSPIGNQPAPAPSKNKALKSTPCETACHCFLNDEIDPKCEKNMCKQGRCSCAVREETVNLPAPDKITVELTAGYAQVLKHRLLAKAELNPNLADDLLYIVEMLDIDFPDLRKRTLKERRRRSVGRNYLRSRKIRTRCSSANSTVTRMSFEGMREDFHSQASDGIDCGYCPKNCMDLFYELQEFKVRSPELEAAVLWFEKRHPFERWDVSAFSSHLDSRIQKYPELIGATGLKNVLDFSTGKITVACSVLCECRMSCPNRTTQQPSTARIALIYIGQPVGFGVFALARIMRGQFVAEYAGELYNGNLYSDDTYLYQFSSNKGKEQWVVDARRVGNVARFINHSCEPNAQTVEVWEHGMLYPRLCIFAKRTILPKEEITITYGDGWWKIKRKNCPSMFCNCGSVRCGFPKPVSQTPSPPKAGSQRKPPRSKQT